MANGKMEKAEFDLAMSGSEDDRWKYTLTTLFELKRWMCDEKAAEKNEAQHHSLTKERCKNIALTAAIVSPLVVFAQLLINYL